jgi:hypothetical protein
MKNIVHYLFGVLLLGTFMGVLISFGHNVLPAIGLYYFLLYITSDDKQSF